AAVGVSAIIVISMSPLAVAGSPSAPVPGSTRSRRGSHAWRRAMSDAVKRVAVVGSGFGGLAVAIRLQAMGLQTVLFEARYKPGGRAYVHEEQGFTFDAGPTVITAPHCLEELYT